MIKVLSLLASSVLMLAAVGCQQPPPAPPPATSANPPPTLTSAPVPAPQPTTQSQPPTSPNGPRWQGNEPPPSVYRFDFVLTPKDPKDPTLTPTAFTLNVVGSEPGGITIGRNVPLQASSGPPMTPGGPPVLHGTPRQDVGLKVNAFIPHGSGPGPGDILLKVEMEMSSVESGNVNGAASIRKLTSHGSTIVPVGKSTIVVSVDDDKKHYDLSVTPTKIR